MCGSCESKMGKAGLGLGVLSTVGAVVLRLTHMTPMNLGSHSLAAAAQLFFLLAIAANTTHGHEPAA